MMFKNLKKAVLISGHLRSFYNAWHKIKEFYGEDTDFYFTVWDHDFINSKNAEYDTEKLKEFLVKEPKVKSLNFISVEDLLNWSNTIKNVDNSIETHYNRFGQIFICYKNVEFSKEHLKNYDLVFRNRLDIYPTLQPHSVDTFNSQLNDLSTLYTMKDFLSFGFFRFGESFFYSSPETYLELFKDLRFKISDILSNPFFKAKEKSLTNHNLWGTVVQFSNIPRVRPSAFGRCRVPI